MPLPAQTRSACADPAAGRQDPFVPLIHANTPRPRCGAAGSTQPSIRFTPRLRLRPLPSARSPCHARPAAPTAAVIWTNGHRQVIGVGQTFKIGEVPFQVVAVTRKAVRLEIVGGAFASGKQAIRVRKGHPLNLANTATGVEYRLLFARGTTEAPIATQAAQPSDSASSTQSTSANAATGS